MKERCPAADRLLVLLAEFRAEVIEECARVADGVSDEARRAADEYGPGGVEDIEATGAGARSCARLIRNLAKEQRT